MVMGQTVDLMTSSFSWQSAEQLGVSGLIKQQPERRPQGSSTQSSATAPGEELHPQHPRRCSYVCPKPRVPAPPQQQAPLAFHPPYRLPGTLNNPMFHVMLFRLLFSMACRHKNKSCTWFRSFKLKTVIVQEVFIYFFACMHIEVFGIFCVKTLFTLTNLHWRAWRSCTLSICTIICWSGFPEVCRAGPRPLCCSITPSPKLAAMTWSCSTPWPSWTSAITGWQAQNCTVSLSGSCECWKP